MSPFYKERAVLAALCGLWLLALAAYALSPAPEKAAPEVQVQVLRTARSQTGPEPSPEAAETPVPDHEIETVARILWAEARGVPSDTEVACVAWTIVNRVDAGYGTDVVSVATAPGQYAYDPDAPLDDRLLYLAGDVLRRWYNGGEGRVLPDGYMWFQGDGVHNYFRNAYTGGEVWDYSAASPYES